MIEVSADEAGEHDPGTEPLPLCLREIGSTIYQYRPTGESADGLVPGLFAALPITGFALIRYHDGSVNDRAREKILAGLEAHESHALSILRNRPVRQRQSRLTYHPYPSPRKQFPGGCVCNTTKGYSYGTPHCSIRERSTGVSTQGPCFTTEELGALVEGWLDCVHLPHGRLLWINTEGKQHGLPSNPLATILARSRLQPGDYIAGPAVVITRQEAGE